MNQDSIYEYLGDYVDGRFLLGDREDGSWTNFSPANLKEKLMSPVYCNDHVDEACGAAKKAFREWSHLSLQDRLGYMAKLREVMVAYEEKMAEVISRETGKPLWEARTESKALVAKIDATTNHSLSIVAEQKVLNALPQVDGYIRYKPRGVMAVLGPFNFPAHLPNGHIVPSLVLGNTVVFKPSDKTPATGQLMAEIFQKAEFPKGVFNLVQGRGDTGKRLAGHDQIDGVLFTGSYEVGLKIKQETLHHYWKILALEMGGKNCSLIWKDADLEKAVYETLLGSFLSAGQRCSCTSKILLHKDVYDPFIESFYRNAKKLSIGYWKNNPFMGPLISKESVENYIRFQEIAKREGAECMMRGKALDLDYPGHYVTPSIYLVEKYEAKSVYQKSEIFGPNVAVYKIDDFDQAMHINNSTGFGLVMAIFSKDRSLYEKALLDARVGLLNWNRTTNGASSRLPFGGMGKSGNDRPSAHFAVNYCSVPVSCLEDETPFDSSQVLPSMEYEFTK
ncbi:MAG: succinylglutamate-semialdehyde dehydrogenase [Bdellovibrionales bacterium]|nr:succinylglutamate-semialdehyde dehydrogenase [Bdellovibrionales bacterium]